MTAGRISLFDDEQRTQPSNPYRDDVVGRISGGYVGDGGAPVSLDQWRFQSDDEVVAQKIADLFGGEVQEVERKKKNETVIEYEVFTKADAVDIVIDSPEAVTSEFTHWSRDGELIGRGDGVTMEDGSADPGYGLELPDRKQKAKQGLVPSPETTVYFRLAADEDLGVFRFVKRDAWNLERNLARNGFYDALDGADGPIKARISRNPVSFVAKNGPRAGKTVSYTETVLEYKGAAE